METNIIFLLTIILIVAIIYVTKWLYHLLWLDWDSNGIPIQGYFWIWLHKYRLAEHLVVNLRESSTRPPFVALRMIFGGPFVYVPLRAETTKRMLMFQTKELCKTPGNDLTRKRQPRLMELSFGNLNGDAWQYVIISPSTVPSDIYFVGITVCLLWFCLLWFFTHSRICHILIFIFVAIF